MRLHTSCLPSCTRDGLHRCCVFLSICGLLLLALFVLASCGGGTMASSTPTPPPPPPSTGPVITDPSSGTSVQSPILFSGSVAGTPKADHSRLLLDGKSSLMYGGVLPMENKWIFVPNGQHTLTLTAYDKSDNPLASTTTNVTISGQTTPAILPKLQTIPQWQWCTQELAGSVCAAGLGQATSTQTLNVASPSLSGATTQFSIGGMKGYSNSLWWISLGGGTPLNTFTYDLDFYIDNADVAEALEFDVNQSFGGTRFTWGTECSYKNTKKWDVWNPETEVWVPSSAPCPPVTSKQWHHLKWQFNRVNNQVHYISVTLDNTTYPINLTFNPEPNWKYEDIDVAFQMDGDAQQDPYNVWLDNVTLTTSY